MFTIRDLLWLTVVAALARGRAEHQAIGQRGIHKM